jgi:hypothetical protein
MANSLYGAIGSQYFALYDIVNAEAITLSGQVSNLSLQSKINDYFHKLGFPEDDYTLAADTDSCFLNLDCFVKKFKPKDPINFLCQFADTKLADVLDGFCKDIWARCNTAENRLSFKREKVISTICFTGKKKRYFCLVHDNEGIRYATPKLSITGLETNRSSTPKFCRDTLTEAFELVIKRDQESLWKLIDKTELLFNTLPVETISFPRGVNDLAKWAVPNDTLYAPGTPQNVKAALTHNHFIAKANLTQYSPIKSGGKIKFCYMKPSPYRTDVFGWGDGAYPVELNIDKYIDRRKMYESAFLGPMQGVTDAIGWTTEKKNDLTDFFE